MTEITADDVKQKIARMARVHFDVRALLTAMKKGRTLVISNNGLPDDASAQFADLNKCGLRGTIYFSTNDAECVGRDVPDPVFDIIEPTDGCVMSIKTGHIASLMEGLIEALTRGVEFSAMDLRNLTREHMLNCVMAKFEERVSSALTTFCRNQFPGIPGGVQGVLSWLKNGCQVGAEDE